MNLQHERIGALCEQIKLPFIAQAYSAAVQQAASAELSYSDFLERVAERRSGRPDDGAVSVLKCWQAENCINFRVLLTPTHVDAEELLSAENLQGTCARQLNLD